jgi:hypothetical protein
MNKEPKTIWDFWWVILMALTYVATAWLLAWWQWVYPPIPMFVSALVGGWLFRGRPQTAVRASLWAGFAWGWIVELAYFSVRLHDPAGEWAKADFWEQLGLGAAEATLYTALLGFFAAFIAWGTEKPKTAATPLPFDASEAPVLRRGEIPFQPEEADLPRPHPLSEKSDPRNPGSR